MKYSVYLLFCGPCGVEPYRLGSLAFAVHGFSTPVTHESEENFSGEVGSVVGKLMRARRRDSGEIGCSGSESMEANDRDECGTKNNKAVVKPGGKQAAQDNLEAEFKKSVDIILNGVKRILVDDVPLFYRYGPTCGKRLTTKCQYTTRNDTDDWFYGYQTVPGESMLRVTDGISSFLNSHLMLIFANSIDEENRAQNTTHVEVEEILEIVQSIVERDPDRVPEKFVCGVQVGRQVECSYDNPEQIMGPQLDLNDGVKRIANSENFRQSVIKFAKEGSRSFPALKDELADKILAILLNA